MLIHRLTVNSQKKIFNVPPNILDYSLDLVRRGSADIPRLVWADFIPHFPQRTGQGGYIFVVFGCTPSSLKLTNL